MPNKSFKIESAASRVLLAMIALLSLVGAFFAVKWMFADSIATNAQGVEIAELAVDLDSGNPQAHYSIAVQKENSFIPEDIPKALAEFEKAAALSPYDYRLWLALGRARERNGDIRGAELALERALKLAPNYAQVQWTYGNVLLRQGKNKEAFALIGRAVEGNPIEYANPAVNTAWLIFEGDLNKIKEVVGDSNYIRAAFATFFVGEKKFDEALSIWNSIPIEERRGVFRKDGENLFGGLLAARKYHYAIRVKNELNAAGGEKLVIGKIYNGGFEKDITEDPSEIFTWKLGTGAQPQIGINTEEKQEGNRSLVMIFGGFNREFRGISQPIIVEPAREYNLKFFYKAELETTAQFVWEIVNVIDNKILATSEPLSSKTGWTPATVNFTVPENSEGIVIQITRAKCDSNLCPTAGRLWFDNFSLN